MVCQEIYFLYVSLREILKHLPEDYSLFTVRCFSTLHYVCLSVCLLHAATVKMTQASITKCSPADSWKIPTLACLCTNWKWFTSHGCIKWEWRRKNLQFSAKTYLTKGAR